MSQEQSAGGGGWPGLLAGGFLGLILIILTNILPTLASFANVFAGINISLLLCILFSPFILIYRFLTYRVSSRATAFVITNIFLYPCIFISPSVLYMLSNPNLKVSSSVGVNIIFGALSALLVGFIMFCLGGIFIIALIIFNVLASGLMAMQLGLLIYDRLYLASRFSKTIIGSPLFAVPLLMVLGYEISRTTSSRQSTAYIFNKAEGTLTQHQLPKGRAPVGKLLAAIMAFLMLGLMIAAAFGV